MFCRFGLLLNEVHERDIENKLKSDHILEYPLVLMHHQMSLWALIRRFDCSYDEVTLGNRSRVYFRRADQLPFLFIHHTLNRREMPKQRDSGTITCFKRGMIVYGEDDMAYVVIGCVKWVFASMHHPPPIRNLDSAFRMWTHRIHVT